MPGSVVRKLILSVFYNSWPHGLSGLYFPTMNYFFKEEDILKEILIFTDRSDISEEVSRLESHLIHFNEEIEKDKNDVGKKLDFILQEMFRELNTMGVKCNLYDISKLVVESKSEVEKIREQVMNIE